MKKEKGPYIYLYRKILKNEPLLRDHTAFGVFIWLLLRADYKTGKVETGRFVGAHDLGLKPTTFYQAIRRLTTKHELVDTSSDNRFTSITILNWNDFQGSDDTSVDTILTTERHQNDTIQGIKGIKELKKENIEMNTSLVETKKVYDLFVDKFDKNPNLYKLTTKRKLKIKARLKDCGFSLIESAIKNLSSSAWHRGDNDRGWVADLDFILRSYEQVEKWANNAPIKQMASDGMVYDNPKQKEEREKYLSKLKLEKEAQNGTRNK